MYLVSSRFSFKPTSSSSSSSSTQFSQEWARRKLVVKHSIKSNKILNNALCLWLCVVRRAACTVLWTMGLHDACSHGSPTGVVLSASQIDLCPVAVGDSNFFSILAWSFTQDGDNELEREGFHWIALKVIAKVRKVRFGSFSHISLY